MDRTTTTARRNLLLAGACLVFAACDGVPTAPGATPPVEPSAQISLAVPAAGLDAPGLVHSEVERVSRVLADEPATGPLLDALRDFDDLVSKGRSSFAAAQLVLTRIDGLDASLSGATVLPELDALRLMLESIRFAEPSSQSRAGQLRRLPVW